MSPRKTLDVFLRGTRIGELKGGGLRLSFQYDRATVAEYGSGSILLSLSMPVSRNTIEGPEVYDFFDGLLPEGQVRSHIAKENGLPTPDAFGLLRVLVPTVPAPCVAASWGLMPGSRPKTSTNRLLGPDG